MKKLISPNDIISSRLCIGCGNCVAQHVGDSVQMGLDKYGEIKPQGDSQWLNKPSEEITMTCPFSPSAMNEDEIASLNFPHAAANSPTIGRYEEAYVGHSSQGSFRENGSSGGMVSWVASALFERGLIDGLVHVVAVSGADRQSPIFEYRISKGLTDIAGGAKSRYYPTEMSGVLRLILENPGRYAVVGVPCFIKALQLLRLKDTIIKDRVHYTLGLFCGHMKSSKMVESFALQSSVDFKSISSIDFRSKKEGRPANLYFANFFLASGKNVERDWELMADGDWGAGFFMNNACNFCDDVVSETADISFGDAWVEPYSSDYRGTNVVIVRRKDLHELVQKGIESADLDLTIVDSKFIEETQAAGIRHRREGLSYRLAKKLPKVRLQKRVIPRHRDIPLSRRISYRLRYSISFWSHKMFFVATKMRLPILYIFWAKVMGTIYNKIIYHRIILASVLMGMIGASISLFTNLGLSVLFTSQILFRKWEYGKVLWYCAIGYPLLISLIQVPLFILLKKRRLSLLYFDLAAVLIILLIVIFSIVQFAPREGTLPYLIFVIADMLIISSFLKRPVN